MAINEQINQPGVALTRAELDQARCEDPACDNKDHGDKIELFLVPGCHREYGVSVAYDQATGLLKIACGVCDRFIAHVKVAET